MEEAPRGRMFGVTFIKRTDGARRNMLVRFPVPPYSRQQGQPPRSWDPRNYNLMQAYDVQAGKHRMINLDGLLRIRSNRTEKRRWKGSSNAMPGGTRTYTQSPTPNQSYPQGLGPDDAPAQPITQLRGPLGAARHRSFLRRGGGINPGVQLGEETEKAMKFQDNRQEFGIRQYRPKTIADMKRMGAPIPSEEEEAAYLQRRQPAIRATARQDIQGEMEQQPSPRARIRAMRLRNARRRGLPFAGSGGQEFGTNRQPVGGAVREARQAGFARQAEADRPHLTTQAPAQAHRPMGKLLVNNVVALPGFGTGLRPLGSEGASGLRTRLRGQEIASGNRDRGVSTDLIHPGNIGLTEFPRSGGGLVPGKVKIRHDPSVRNKLREYDRSRRKPIGFQGGQQEFRSEEDDPRRRPNAPPNVGTQTRAEIQESGSPEIRAMRSRNARRRGLPFAGSGGQEFGTNRQPVGGAVREARQAGFARQAEADRPHLAERVDNRTASPPSPIGRGSYEMTQKARYHRPDPRIRPPLEKDTGGASNPVGTGLPGHEAPMSPQELTGMGMGSHGGMLSERISLASNEMTPERAGGTLLSPGVVNINRIRLSSQLKDPRFARKLRGLGFQAEGQEFQGGSNRGMRPRGPGVYPEPLFNNVVQQPGFGSGNLNTNVAGLSDSMNDVGLQESLRGLNIRSNSPLNRNRVAGRNRPPGTANPRIVRESNLIGQPEPELVPGKVKIRHDPSVRNKLREYDRSRRKPIGFQGGQQEFRSEEDDPRRRPNAPPNVGTQTRAEIQESGSPEIRAMQEGAQAGFLRPQAPATSREVPRPTFTPSAGTGQTGESGVLFPGVGRNRPNVANVLRRLQQQRLDTGALPPGVSEGQVPRTIRGSTPSQAAKEEGFRRTTGASGAAPGLGAARSPESLRALTAQPRRLGLPDPRAGRVLTPSAAPTQLPAASRSALPAQRRGGGLQTAGSFPLSTALRRQRLNVIEARGELGRAGPQSQLSRTRQVPRAAGRPGLTGQPTRQLGNQRPTFGLPGQGASRRILTRQGLQGRLPGALQSRFIRQLQGALRRRGLASAFGPAIDDARGAADPTLAARRAIEGVGRRQLSGVRRRRQPVFQGAAS